MQAALEDLVKAPSNKLFPFVKLLLAENSLMKSSAEAAEPNGIQVYLVSLSSLTTGLFNFLRLKASAIQTARRM